jgi:4-amino-4-deoxy-L-arabinose transferase-like glycosyltransferase
MPRPTSEPPEASPSAAAPARDRRLLWLTLAALAVRIAFLLAEPETRPVADERTWTNWAVDNLVLPKVRFSPLRTHMIFHPPLYPYFIAVPFELFGTLTAVKWFQVVVSALLVPAVGRIGTRVFGARAGVAAAFLVAFYPELIWFSVHFWCETLFLALLWWAFERLLAADARGSTWLAVSAGLLWGLAILTRETGLYLTPLAALWMATRRPWKRSLRPAAAFLLTALLAVAPWTYRNWLQFRAFVPVSTAGGLALFQGNAPLSRQEVYDVYDAVYGRVDQYRAAQRLGIQAVLDRQPWWLFEKLGEQMPKFWEADSLAIIHIKRGAYGEVPPASAIAAAAVVLLPYLAVLALFVAGLAALRLDRPTVLLLGFLVAYNLLHVATHGFARYRLPVMPVVFLVAGSAWAAWRRGTYPQLSRRRRILACGLAAAFAITLVPSIRANAAHPAFGLTDREAPPIEEVR